MMEKTLDMYNATAVPAANVPMEERANPKYFDYTWTNWLAFYEPLYSEFTNDIL